MNNKFYIFDFTLILILKFQPSMPLMKNQQLALAHRTFCTRLDTGLIIRNILHSNYNWFSQRCSLRALCRGLCRGIWFLLVRRHSQPSAQFAVSLWRTCYAIANLSTFISDFVGCQHRSKYDEEKCICEGIATFVRSSRMLVDPIAGQE